MALAAYAVGLGFAKTRLFLAKTGGLPIAAALGAGLALTAYAASVPHASDLVGGFVVGWFTAHVVVHGGRAHGPR